MHDGKRDADGARKALGIQRPEACSCRAGCPGESHSSTARKERLGQDWSCFLSILLKSHFHGQDFGNFSWQLPAELFRVLLSPLGTVGFVLLQ